MKLILGTMTFGQQVEENEAVQMLKHFKESGYKELDTAYVYNSGESEKIIGRIFNHLNPNDYSLATKAHPRITGRLDYSSMMSQFETSISRMKVSELDILYIHFPDMNTPIESALQACNELYKQGKIKKVGISNFSAAEVKAACEKCILNGWIKPTVYQGVYNALSRKAEGELFEVLRAYDMKFYSYNPLAGGVLTGKYLSFEEKPKDGRFVCRQNYQNRYWKKSYFEAVEIIGRVCEEYGITMVEGAFRWLAFHSCLEADKGDGIVVGVSNLQQLQSNIEAIKGGPLPERVRSAFEYTWKLCEEDAPEYYRYYTSE